MSNLNFKFEPDLVDAVVKVFKEKYPELAIKSPTDAIRQVLRDFIKSNKTVEVVE